MSEFTCFNCEVTYEKINDENWNDFKAAEEMLALYPESKNDPTESFCDDCNENFKKWFATLTEDDKKRIRMEMGYE